MIAVHHDPPHNSHNAGFDGGGNHLLLVLPIIKGTVDDREVMRYAETQTEREET
jgi:hypothetical protein